LSVEQCQLKLDLIIDVISHSGDGKI